jgi:hypothetical protein
LLRKNIPASKAGLPDVFSDQKSLFGYILEGLAMEGIGVLYGHLVYFKAIWYILWLFGIFCGHLVYFVVIWYILWLFGIFCPRYGICIVPDKSCNPGLRPTGKTTKNILPLLR